MISTLHYISQGDTHEEQVKNILQACDNGAELVQLRLKNVGEKIVLRTAIKVREITAKFKTKLIINDYYKVAKEVKAEGVHLGKSDACPSVAREYLGDNYIIGGTANTLQDCKILIEKKVDYIGLGPFRYTTTKENLSPVIGIKGYMAIIEELNNNTPIIAIGGVTLEDVSNIMTTGVHGIAISGEITRNFKAIPKFKNKLIAASGNEKVCEQ